MKGIMHGHYAGRQPLSIGSMTKDGVGTSGGSTVRPGSYAKGKKKLSTRRDDSRRMQQKMKKPGPGTKTVIKSPWPSVDII